MFLKPPLDSVPHLMRPVRALGDACRHRLPGSIEHGAHLVVAGHVAVRDGDVFRRARVAEREGALRADAVVPGRVHGAVARRARCGSSRCRCRRGWYRSSRLSMVQVIDAGRENAEPAALQNREIAQQHVVAVLQRDRLVADARGWVTLESLIAIAPRLSPLPQISPRPKIAMSCRSSPQIRLLCQWL